VKANTSNENFFNSYYLVTVCTGKNSKELYTKKLDFIKRKSLGAMKKKVFLKTKIGLQ